MTEVHEALAHPGLSDEDKLAIEWQFRMFGGFRTKLWDALTAADTGNLEKLRLAFPKDVAALERFRTGALRHKLASLGMGDLL